MPRRQGPPPDAEIVTLFIEHGSYAAVGKIFGVKRATMRSRIQKIMGAEQASRFAKYGVVSSGRRKQIAAVAKNNPDMSLSQIGRTMGCSKDIVKRVCIEQGIVRPNRPLVAKDWPRIPLSAARRIPTSKIQKLIELGLSYREVAKKLGVTKGMIERRMMAANAGVVEPKEPGVRQGPTDAQLRRWNMESRRYHNPSMGARGATSLAMTEGW